MGVPVIALEGAAHRARVGVSLLHAVGLQRLVAASRDGYRALATGLAGDLDALARLRAGLRRQVANSALCDGPSFARTVEQAYREMWRTWCATQQI